MKFKSFSVLILLFSLINAPAYAQVKGGELNDLFDLFLMEDYIGCLKKATKLSEKDDYSKNPEPLLYMAMCYYQISLDPEATATEEFKDAYKEALKYTAKAAKKDNEELNLMAQNEEFLSKLKERGAEEAKYFYNEDNYSKAASTYARILKADLNDEGLMLMTAACQLLAKNVGEGQKLADEAIDLIKQKYADKSYTAPDVTYNHMVDAAIIYTNYLNDSGQGEKAKDVISALRTLIPKEESIKAQYNKLM